MPIPAQFFRAEVLRAYALTPAMRRIVLGGSGLQGYASTGHADEWIQLRLPVEGSTNVDLPSEVDGGWVFAEPEPVSRWYTVRRWDGDAGELTVDVVIHAHGVATGWAAAASVGDQIVVSTPAGRYGAAPDAQWELIVADLTGLPAAGRILEELPAGRKAIAILEVPDEASQLTFESEADLRVCWIYNPTPDVFASTLGVATRSLELPEGPGYVWMAGEAACSRDLRRYFRHELSLPASAYDIVAYWRPEAESYKRRYALVQDELMQIYVDGQAAGRDEEDSLDEVFAVMETHGL